MPINAVKYLSPGLAGHQPGVVHAAQRLFAESLPGFPGAALVSQVVGYVAVGCALGHLSASVVSPTMLGQPVLSALLAIRLLGETLQPVQWTGRIIVLSGIYLVHFSQNRVPVGFKQAMVK